VFFSETVLRPTLKPWNPGPKIVEDFEAAAKDSKKVSEWWFTW